MQEQAYFSIQLQNKQTRPQGKEVKKKYIIYNYHTIPREQNSGHLHEFTSKIRENSFLYRRRPDTSTQQYETAAMLRSLEHTTAAHAAAVPNLAKRPHGQPKIHL